MAPSTEDAVNVAAIAVDPGTGKLLVAGGTNGVALQPILLRFRTDGTLDPTFLAEPTVPAYGYSVVAVQADGKVVAAGAASDGAVIVRLLPNGTLDPSFANDGIRLLLPYGLVSVTSIMEAPGGSLVLCGQTRADPPPPPGATRSIFPFIARILSDGQLDPTFNGTGFLQPEFEQSAVCNGAVAQSDGSTLVAISVQDRVSTPLVIRVDPAGRLDSSFGEGGRATARIGVRSRPTLDDRGRPYIAGYTSESNATLAVERWSAAGKGDPQFGDAGVVAIDIPGSRGSEAPAIALQADGKPVVLGSLLDNESTSSARVGLAVARLQPAGGLDSTFGAGGTFTMSLGVQGEAYDMALAPNGRIVILADTWDGSGAHPVIVRLCP